MLILRAIVLLLLLAMALCVAVGVLSGRRHYFTWARRLFQVTVVVAVVFMVLYLLERLIAPVI